MSFSYNQLWRMLSDLGTSKMDFAKQIGMSNTTLAKLGKNEPITLSTIDKICNEYGCKIEDIVTHIPDIKYNNYHSLPPIGTIVIGTNIPKSSTHSNYYVIINIAKPSQELKDREIPPSFLIAQIIDINLGGSVFNIKFKDVLINHDKKDGYIALGMSFWSTSDFISGNFGKIPDDVMDKVREIMYVATNVH